MADQADSKGFAARDRVARALSVMRRRGVWIPTVAGVTLVALGGVAIAGAVADGDSIAAPSSSPSPVAPAPSATPEESASALPETSPTPSPTAQEPSPEPTEPDEELPQYPYVWPGDGAVTEQVLFEDGSDYTSLPEFSADGSYLMITRGTEGNEGDVAFFGSDTGAEVVVTPRATSYPVASAWLPESNDRAMVAAVRSGELTVWLVDAGAGTTTEVLTIDDVQPERLVAGDDRLYLTYRDADPRKEVDAEAYKTQELSVAGDAVGKPQPYMAVHPAADGSGAWGWKATGDDEVGMFVLDSPRLASAKAAPVDGMDYPDHIHSAPPVAVTSPTGSGYLIAQPADEYTWAVWNADALTSSPSRLAGGGLGVEDLAFSDDGDKALAILDAQGRPHLMAVDIASGDDLPGDGASGENSWELRVAGFVPGGAEYVTQLVSTGGDFDVVDVSVFDAPTGEFQGSAYISPLRVLLERPVWSPDGQSLVTVGTNDDGQLTAVLRNAG